MQSLNEEDLQNIVLTAPIGICILDASTLISEMVNEKFLEVAGKPFDAIAGKFYWDAFAEARPYYEQALDQVVREGESYHANEVELMLVRHGKEEMIFVTFVYSPVKNKEGKVSKVAVWVLENTRQVVARRESERNNAKIHSLNEEIMASNEELATVNEELAAMNEELSESQRILQRNERLFRSIAINIPNSVIMVIDKEHRYVMVEGDLMEKMGYERTDYEGKHPTEIGQTDRYNASKHLYDRMMAGEAFSIEHDTPTGEMYLIHLVPLKNEYGEVEAGLVMAMDVTSIKQAEERSAKLAAIIESSDDAIISKTLESVITSWNDSAQRMFGYTADEIIGQTIYKLIPEDRLEEEPQILSRLKTGERVEHFETKRLTKEGKLIDVSLTISPIKNKEGNITGLSKIARDITEKKMDEIRKNDFIGMVSHELKTPLTSLSALIQVANAKSRASKDVFMAGAMEKAGIQVKRMTSMINGFLNISRLEAGKILIEKELFRIDELLQEIIEETNLIVSTHTISLSASGEVTVNADWDKISSVISNLISNAVKYSPKGKSIKIDYTVRDQNVVVSVRDEGMGLKASDLEKIFDRYYRIEADHTRHISGFGIGLYLSAEIIKQHGGKIWAESKTGKGSTFYFSLPL
jgi:PAS domain S-box-containing protein